MCRVDFNIIGIFLIFILLAQYMNKDPSFASLKINLILMILVVIDALFLIIMLFVWITSKGEVEYWRSLYAIHSVCYYLALAEIGLKVVGIMLFKKGNNNLNTESNQIMDPAKSYSNSNRYDGF